MQEIFTQATVAVELFGFSYLAGSFAVYAHRRLHQSARWVAPGSAPTQPRVQEQIPALNPKPKLPSVEHLRQQCQRVGIKWRNAHGKNKHLKQAEMIAALAALHTSEGTRKTPPKSETVKSYQRQAA
ncbi:hypothetical protein K9N68_35415 (plasmid) [Kovacikia minuta CCNUW1]|uniref:hypothetical protein n=1 Tax=Kovacikia minuta TaxID=2931930 RepID=UPI001CCDE603|nr:hypothetical protein [Kovacikia minuta]UBF30480.1 hypothetical protein K9N68_35415 [Kovacikia minuta CCNUW1]